MSKQGNETETGWLLPEGHRLASYHSGERRRDPNGELWEMGEDMPQSHPPLRVWDLNCLSTHFCHFLVLGCPKDPLIPWQVQSALCMGRVGRKSCQAKRCRCWDLEVQLMDQGDVGGILMCAKLLQPCPTLCYPMACSPPGSLSMGFSR